ncbi:MAG: hypothetical protein U5K79_24040 [Cyclobacteriaceae bacterium]|nr:hypothetical protein [Cyclobacteriaceae bacterium]
MFKLNLLLLSALVITSCSMQGNNQAANLELVSNYVKAVENMDYEAMGNYLDDTYMGVGPSVGDSINKDQAIETWQFNIENVYESIKYDRNRNIAVTITEGENQGDWVSNWAELSINYKENAGSVNIFANTLYQIKNGKIVKSYTIYNEADALRQLGFIFMNPNEF